MFQGDGLHPQQFPLTLLVLAISSSMQDKELA